MFSQHIFQILSTYWRLRSYCVNICIILFCERFLTNCGILNPSSLIKLYLHITLLSILNKVNCLNLHQLHSSSSRQEKSNPSISIFGGNETTGTGLVWGCCCEKSTRCQNILVPGGGLCYGGVGAELHSAARLDGKAGLHTPDGCEGKQSALLDYHLPLLYNRNSMRSCWCSDKQPTPGKTWLRCNH